MRSNLVIQALLHAASDLKIFVRTTAPQWLFHGQAARVVYSSQATDVGILQRDSLEMDLKETLRACRVLHAKIPLLIKEEVEFIKKHEPVAVGERHHERRDLAFLADAERVRQHVSERRLRDGEEE